MYLTLILATISGDKLLSALLDDSLGLFVFGIVLIGSAICLRWFFNRQSAGKSSEKIENKAN